MFFGEGAKSTDDVLFDLGAILLCIARGVGYHGGREISRVNGVVDGYSDLEFGVVVYWATSDAGPYGLGRKGVSVGKG